MKKFLSLLLTVLIVFSLTACGGGRDSNIENAAWDELERLGKIHSEDGRDYLSITLPSDFVDDDITQESLNKNKGKEYTSAILNEDGSVTYIMNKKQHKAMLEDVREAFDKAVQEIVESPDFAFTSVKCNEDFTVFDAYLSTEELGVSEGFMVLGFYIFGGMYGVFSGHEDKNMTVNFYSKSGKLLETVNSSDFN